MPTWLTKDCLDVLISPITNRVNKSLSLGAFPKSIKAALGKPLIKNHTMGCNILNNYRPVSNLTFLSKVIERVVAFHLSKYLININLNESLYSLSMKVVTVVISTSFNYTSIVLYCGTATTTPLYIIISPYCGDTYRFVVYC